MKSIIQFYSSRKNAFKYAFQGLFYLLKTQRNSWVHAAATVCVILLAAWLSLGITDWAILILTIASVWTAEAVNTAIEVTVDLSSPQIQPLAKIAKDSSAAAVLIAAIASVIIGLLILGPPLYQRLLFWFISR